MSDPKREKPKRRFKLQLPHVYTIAFLLIAFFAVLTWVVPSGQFDRQTIQTAAGEREVAVAGTYHEVDKVYTDPETGEEVDLRQGLGAVLQAPTKGIQAAGQLRGIRPADRWIVRRAGQDERLECGHEPRGQEAQEQGHPDHPDHHGPALDLRLDLRHVGGGAAVLRDLHPDHDGHRI